MLDLRNEPNHPLYGDNTVAITTSISPGLSDYVHPLAIAVNDAVAKSLHRHFSKENTWDDCTQTGSWCNVVSRTYCLNHESYEREYDPLEEIFSDELSFA